MQNFVAIAFFTLAVSMLYTGVAQFLPQLENHPPPVVALGSNIGPEELAPIGATAFEANCSSCHKPGESTRAPDLTGMGTKAFERAAERSAETGKNFTDVDYLMEALCKPGDYLVEGYGNIMPPQGKALSGGQLLAVVAYLQNLGGEATVKGTDTEPVMRFGCVSGDGGGGAAVAAEASAPVDLGPPEKVYVAFGCETCHALDEPTRKIGPSLQGVGARLSKGEIYESILAPDAALTPGDPPYASGVMKQTLDGNGFYEKMTPGDYQALVDWLAGMKE